MEISLLADKPEASKVIAQWYFDEWLSNVPDITVEFIQDKVSKAGNRDKIPLTVVAHNDQELIGVVEVKLHENRHYPDYEHWLGGIYVKPSHRGQGISSVLIGQGIEYAAQFGVSSLYLQCESHNVGLYERHGFKFLHEGKHRLPVSIMMLELST
ncbi:GNAT family N-acetyltransferase [Shewanella holmiensis]|uniref:GNAT family N-acetyltransferase n=1 Tax=Shewanella holmiensis TaxID=2952222 RepID=A0A9X2WPN4_9GAMM|nr:GNAT family N-acetyltransferase [Shewanella holmiensis]MCT7943034.1 GNAT family N-acetyltransferase [Shewanella holmiensis]